MTDTQQVDTQPGHYYVTACRDGKYAFLLGPYTNDHAKALAKVDDVRKVAERLDPRCVFDAFGTGRIASDFIAVPQGKLNQYGYMDL